MLSTKLDTVIDWNESKRAAKSAPGARICWIRGKDIVEFRFQQDEAGYKVSLRINPCPAMIIADEPSNGLDAKARNSC